MDGIGSSPYPIYSQYFLIEYYGVKGSKGTRRLGRWSPDPSLLLINTSDDEPNSKDSPNEDITSVESIALNDNDLDDAYQAVMRASQQQGGVFLANAQIDDLGGTLHLRGAKAAKSDDLGSVSVDPKCTMSSR